MQASVITGPCFSYDAVVSAALPLITSSGTALAFCQNVPFTAAIPLVKAAGSGCDGASLCWSSSQRLETAVDEGPALTELTIGNGVSMPKMIVSEQSTAKAVYAFERFVPQPEDGYGALTPHAALILVTVVQPGGDVGYLTMSPTATGSADTPVYATAIVTKQQAVTSHAMWGVVGASDTTDAILMYYDDAIASKSGGKALPLVQLFSWGSDMYLSRGDVTKGSTGTFGAFHGVTTAMSKFMTLNPDLILYDPATMKQLPLTLPQLSTTDPDNGASNMRWSLTALPLTDYSAHVYMSTYCSAPLTGSACPAGVKLCSAWTGVGTISSSCQYVGKLFADEKDAAIQTLCGDNASADILAAPECACVNPAKSTYGITAAAVAKWRQTQPALAADKTILDSAPPQCILPSCVMPNAQTILPRNLSCTQQQVQCGKEMAASKFGSTTLRTSDVAACQKGWTPSSNSALSAGQIAAIVVGSVVFVVVCIVFIVVLVKRHRAEKL